MSFSDLPEPQQREFSHEERNARHWQVISTFVTFVAGYSVLHKLLIPFFLKFTQVSKSPYTQIDPFFIPAVILAYLLSQKKNNSIFISLLCGFGVIYGVSEVFHVIQGRYEGWLAVSRLLAAVPLAIASGYVMSQYSGERSFSMAWLGAGIGLLTFFISVFPKETAIEKVEQQKPAESRQIIGVNQECGNSQLSMALNGNYPQSSTVVIDPQCGFKPAILRLDKATLTILNQTQTPINVHLMVLDKSKQSSRWNMMIPPGASLETPKIPMKELEAGFLYSDNTPLIGVVGLVLQTSSSEQKIHISRSPLKIEAIP